MIDGEWVGADEELDRDPVAGPLGRQLEERLRNLREELSAPMNRYNFRGRLRKRLDEERE